jgi:diaminohydroxyphosphoribosylaminopyrimidine deaminase/5-amino-6-(5-phosphoribosylamino)uracil reductase
MRLAIQQGENGRTTAPPNPWVGCVIVKNNEEISAGYHKKAGTAHAEIVAINSSAVSVSDATMYVTLEPCCHYGRTGPCTDVLIREQIKRVVIGVLDPDERVSGKGIKQLKEAGIQIDFIEDIDKRINGRGKKFCRLV